jgi:hypothetical protein
MSIEVTCFFCKTDMDKTGAVLWSPPFDPPIFTPYKSGETPITCDKFHICRKCFKEIMKKNVRKIIERGVKNYVIKKS